MNKERYNQIIDETYKNFKNSFPMKKSNPPKDYINSKGQLLTKEEFIDKCKTDTEFSEKWGLVIEERELSLEERLDLLKKLEIFQERAIDNAKSEMIHSLAVSHNIPTKQLTITYNDKTITYNVKTIETYE